MRETNRPGILMVSKPVVPPWSDSGKNLVRDIVASGRDYEYHVLATKGADAPGPHAVVEPIYSTRGVYSPGLGQNAAVLRRLFRPDKLALYHFFFAPNKLTSTVAKMVLGIKRRRTVHTICSVPRSWDGLDKLLFADRIVVLSRHTRAQFEAHTSRPVVHIPPCVPVRERVSRPRREAVREALALPDRPLVLFAGDYQFSNAARICARALPQILGQTQAHFVFAVRIKQEESRALEATLKEEVAAAGLAERVSFFNEVEDMEALAALVDLQVMPADSLYAKMDIPLVLLESMREEVPVVVSTHGPLAELARGGAARAVETGDHEALAAAVVEILRSPDARQKLGARGRAQVLAEYSPDHVAAQYERLYDSLLHDQASE